MHTLHDYVARQLADKIKARRIVVWYDERGEFAPFVNELRGGPRAGFEPAPVSVGGSGARLLEFAGSMFELRAAVEPLACGDAPENVVVYLPGCARDKHGSVLMELEKAGATWEPQLKQLAKNVLLQKYTLGQVDEMLPFERKVTYEDLARAAAGGAGAEPPSILKSIFHDASGNDALLAAWLVSDKRDAEIVQKDASPELLKLIRARLGLDLDAKTDLAKQRAITLRYVLAGEFRSDLSCDPPASLDGVPRPPAKDEAAAVRELARRLRTSSAEAYAPIADQLEKELGLANAKLDAAALGSIDTFRFEERALLSRAGGLISAGRFEEALSLVTAREHSFWLDRDVERKAQWEACRRMAELGQVAAQVMAALSKAPADARAWVDAYVAADGWHRLDQVQRRMEAWVAKLAEEPDERPLGIVRRAYDDVCHALAEGFASALVKAKWALPGAPHQTDVFGEFVGGHVTPVAYFLVDALRFEMGTELRERLPANSEVTVRHAVGSLPSITPIGMAALQPGAASSFSVVEEGGKLGARIDAAFLPDVVARRKFAAAKVPTLVDLGLDELLGLSSAMLKKRVEGAKVVVVRSQEIDHAGEAGFIFQARQVMDTVIDNLARAIRKLAAAGVSAAVVTADHGHLFFGTERDESMRIDSPGGDTVELHRRCWIGRGGSTPASCIRVSGAALGYATDLDFVFPKGAGVFKAGGALAFVHGGPSLQELIIPVISVRTKVEETGKTKSKALSVTGLPARVTNRIFTATMQQGEQNLALFASPTVVRPFLTAAGRQVGAVGMAIDAQLDQATGCVTIQPGKSATVAFQLSDDSVKSVRVVVLDPATDAELYRSPEDLAVQLGV
jgi:hypothetical protein